jgi:hypothetical protein
LIVRVHKRWKDREASLRALGFTDC